MSEPLQVAPASAPAPDPIARSQPAPAPAPLVRCRMCGSTPAEMVTYRRHTGMLLLMRFSGTAGPFCRDCGLHTFRKAQAYTLLAGWWGWASFFIAPITMLVNLARRGRVAKLAPPSNAAPGYQPADPGRPVYQRLAIAGLLVPVLVVGAIVVAAVTAPDDASAVGRCIQADADGSNVTVVDCSQPHQGIVTQVAVDESGCPSDNIGVVTQHEGADDTKVLCIGRG